MPALFRGLDFDSNYLTNWGVAYERREGSREMKPTCVWSIHAPLGDTYGDRLGVWFDGFQFADYVYEVNPKPIEPPQPKISRPRQAPLEQLDPRLREFVHPTTK